MTAVTLHPVPTWRDVAREQVRAAGLHMRQAGILFIVVMTVFAAIAIRATVAAAHAPPNFSYTPDISVLVTYFALLVPALAWHDEKPSKRMYHQSMPVPGPEHALTRVFAGWVWVVAATAVFVIFVVAIDEVARSVVGRPFNTYPQIAAWQWLVPFTSASVAYVFASAAAVGTESPAVWAIGVPVLYAGFAIALGMFGMGHAAANMLKLFSGYLGAGAAMGGTVRDVNAAGQVLEPSVSRWVEATALWGAAGCAILYAVSRRRPAG